MNVLTATIGDEERTAWFSSNMEYRNKLDIVWDVSKPLFVTIGLNPSTATHEKDDPTIRKCKKWAKLRGFGGYRMLNIFALRSTDYKALFKHADPIGPDNTLEFIRESCAGNLTIACWGAHTMERAWKHSFRGHEVAEAVDGLLCFRKTKKGHPEHPLYLPLGTLSPAPFSYADWQAPGMDVVKSLLGGTTCDQVKLNMESGK